MKTAEALAEITARLAAAGIEAPRREARIILAAALGTDAAGLLRIGEVAPARFEPMLARRAAREPLAYILGRREFWGLMFETGPATLIPRPDSETLIEAAIALFPDRSGIRRILDLGTGTGCLLLAALSEFSAAFGAGVDIAPAAAAVARRNAKNLGLSGRAAFFVGNWAGALNARFDLVLANPPYIPRGDLPGLPPEIRDHEPGAALDGGEDGFAAYDAILAALPALLASGGAAVLELGAGQASGFETRARNHGFGVAFRPDLAGIVRAAIITRPA